jgi:Uma2 family endonuclease
MADDPVRREIHNGVLVEMSPSGYTSTELAAYLLHRIAGHVFQHRLGRIAGADGGFILSQDPYVLLSPDVAFISTEHPKPKDDKFYNHAPDLAVEVISPSERAGDIQEKVQTYLKYGTKLVWLIYPKQRQIVVSKQGSSQSDTLKVENKLDGGDVLPGFLLPVSELFAILDDE